MDSEKGPTKASRTPAVGLTNREVIQVRSLDFS